MNDVQLSRFLAALVLGGCLGSVQVSSGQGPETIGEWEPLIGYDMTPGWGGADIAVHSVLLKTGKVLQISSLGDWWLFDPVDDSKTNITKIVPTVFCAGHSQLPDGRILFVGGGLNEPGHDQTAIFDPDGPVTDPWTVMDIIPPNADPPAVGRR